MQMDHNHIGMAGFQCDNNQHCFSLTYGLNNSGWIFVVYFYFVKNIVGLVNWL